MESVTVNVLMLGPARDFAGVVSCNLALPAPATVADLRRALADRFESLAPALPTVRFAVRDEFVEDADGLADGDEVAVIPPVSGGTNTDRYVHLTRAPIDVAGVRAFVGGDPRFGGLLTFEGATRGERDDHHGALLRLDYQAHQSMAKKQMDKLASLALQRWGPGKIAMLHRIGSVAPGEVSVMIAVAFGHRREAFDACRWLIETLKHDVPIWKKDVFADGHVRWVEGEAYKQNGQ